MWKIKNGKRYRLKMKIGFITTIDTNIGDDFIRQGIVNILESAYPDKNLKFVSVNKHLPDTAYPSWHILHYATKPTGIRGGNRFLALFKKHLVKLGGSKFDGCDLIIQSGAPVLWPNCQECEWNIPIWQEIIGRLYTKIPVFNIAAGSCYPWENQPETFPSRGEEEYAKMIGNLCHLTTTRDRLSHALFKKVGIQNTILPCTAFFVDKHFTNDNSKDYILINYMAGGGHFNWGQNINKQSWEETMKKVIDDLKTKSEVRFICHDEKEVQLASQLDPRLKIHYPKSVSEYLECIRHAKLGINNRMHASVAMASVGVPSISICTDTRLLMLDNLQLPIFYVKDISASQLISESDKLLSKAKNEKERLFNLKKRSFVTYQELFKKTFN